MNIRSRSLHYQEFHALLSSLKIDFQVFGLSEIKASMNAPIKSNLQLSGYTFYHTLSLSAAGGVGIYSKEISQHAKEKILSISNWEFETLWVETDNSRSKNILCCCAYRHPSSDTPKFTQHIQETLCFFANEDKIIHIIGDFTINLLNHGYHTLTDDFINLMFSSHFMPSTLHPTRITNASSTLIDNILLINVTDCNILSGNLLSMISGHLPQFAILKYNAPEFKKTSYFAHDYRKFDEASSLSEYSELEISYLNDDSTDLNIKVDTFFLNLD